MTLLKMSLYGAVIILAIVLIRALTLHKLPKKIFVILWSIALLRLLIPFEISSSFSIYSLLPERQTTTEQTYRQWEPNLTAPSEDFAFDPLPLPYMQETTEPTVQMTGNTSNSLSFRQLLPMLWGIGTVLCALYFFMSYLKCYREFSTSLPVKEPFATEWLNAHPLRRTISIRQSDRIETPLTYGVFRPVILLPKTMDWQNRQQTDYILYHEFTHIRRFDQVTKLLMIAALCLHWINPLVWLMYYLFNRDIELSCDELVLRHHSENRSSYAMALIHMEERRTNTAPLFSHFSENAIEERIVAIMKMQKITFGAVLLSVVLVLVVVITLATSAKTTNVAPNPETDATRPKVTFTPTPTPDPGPTATPSPTPNPAPTTTPPLSIYPTNGSYAAIVKGCMEDVLMLDFVEYITDDDVKRKAELIEQLNLSVENADLDTNGNFINGYYIYNTESYIVHYPVAKDVEIRLINNDAKENNPKDDYIITDDLSAFITSVYTEYGWSKMPYFFEIENGVITGILEKMIP